MALCSGLCVYVWCLCACVCWRDANELMGPRKEGMDKVAISLLLGSGSGTSLCKAITLRGSQPNGGNKTPVRGFVRAPCVSPAP